MDQKPNFGTIGQSESEILYVLKSATLGAYIFQGGRSTWSFFASQGFILSIPNPKHQRLPWDSFFVDPGKGDPGSTQEIFLKKKVLNVTTIKIFPDKKFI